MFLSPIQMGKNLGPDSQFQSNKAFCSEIYLSVEQRN